MTLTITTEETLNTFHFWGQAVDNAAKLTYNELEVLTDVLALCYESMTATELNDLMAFDFEHLCDLIDLDVNEVEARGE